MVIALIVICVKSYYAINYNSIQKLEETIENNETKISQIEISKQSLHNTAECFRKNNIDDAEFILLLQDKWEQLESERKELEDANRYYWKELENRLLRKKLLGTFELTAYCQGTITSTGTKPLPNRTIAVDPSVIPYGSIVEIEGYGTYVAEDCGGAVKGNIVDIYIPNYNDCIKFGRRKANVYVINKEGENQ